MNAARVSGSQIDQCVGGLPPGYGEKDESTSSDGEFEPVGEGDGGLGAGLGRLSDAERLGMGHGGEDGVDPGEGGVS